MEVKGKKIKKRYILVVVLAALIGGIDCAALCSDEHGGNRAEGEVGRGRVR